MTVEINMRCQCGALRKYRAGMAHQEMFACRECRAAALAGAVRQQQRRAGLRVPWTLIAVLFVLGLVMLFGIVLRGYAQPSAPESDEVATLARALRTAVSADGRWPVRHCALAGRPIPDGDRWARCDRRLRAFAGMFVEAGARHGVDPYLLAAMASRESGLYPWALGAVGEVGILQLHPHGVGRDIARRLARPGVRARCERQAGACQAEVVDTAARHLRACLAACGTVSGALGAYNRGRCGETSYSRNVLSRLEELLLAGEESEG